MHFVVSWDIEAKSDRWNTINLDLRGTLDGHSWVRPLSTFYIVKIASQEQWNKIFAAITEKRKGYPEVIRVVMSPLMRGGRYNGLLPKDMWEKVNKRTEE